ncbi:hypothetical protein [Nostoc sp. JL33]|uniref:hypothetical protein n=1 Tax=Nostoc sp. JL33 TaxID=2815396 RepID=UPI0025CFA76D|nr:hypothetical protein [Nostoc sp. JL33]MBN3869764.1 hypothetical protein [Nostoc sp. JL33]
MSHKIFPDEESSGVLSAIIVTELVKVLLFTLIRVPGDSALFRYLADALFAIVKVTSPE